MEEDVLRNEEGSAEQEVPARDAAASHRTLQLTGMYESWFLDYASYVILERAVPEALDGLKPVQRRILHAMREMEDGRFHKVANIIGQTMQFHPHGDASIGDALVQLGQKDLLVETQGNWGNILTGDSAAAPRYIEARLSKFALEVMFNPKITHWKLSYDGRKREPVILPAKFPLLLAIGVEGIAVGLASKILPHNFVEILDAAIALLEEREYALYPDFPTGGYVDVTRYSEGMRGGRVRLRARIQQLDKKTLVIREIPFYTTTGALIDTILAANEKGKIRIRKIDDNTAEQVEILIHLAPNVSPDQTIDALYAFTDCEMSVSPNTCVIHNGKPQFLGVNELLRLSVDQTVELLGRELEIRMEELREQWHFQSLERIFIENRIYRKIEKSVTWEEVIDTIDKGLQPFTGKLERAVTRDDIIRLTEIRIKRISRYDIDRAADQILKIEEEMQVVQTKLDHLIDHAIEWYTGLREKYGKGRERKAEIRNFENIEASMVAAATQKLYVNREEGFAGTGLRKDEYVCDCSDIDDIIAFRSDGTYVVTRVAEKVFIGKDIIHIDVFRKNDERTIYNVVYQDGKLGNALVKRCAITGVTRDKEYDISAGKKGSRILYFTANPNGEAEVIHVALRPKPRMKRVSFDFDFSGLPVRGRASKGIILSKNQVRKITKKEEGVSTLDAIGIWYDETVNRINSEERGEFIGQFKGEDRIIGYNRSGTYRTYGFDPTTHFEEDVFLVRKYDPEEVTTIIYVDGESRDHYIKRFVADDSDKLVRLISGHPESRLVSLSLHPQPTFLVHGTKRTKAADPVVEEVEAAEHIAVKGVTAKGKKLCGFDVLRVEEMGQQQQEQDHPDQSDEASQDQDQDHTDQSDEASQGPEQEQVHPDQSDEASQGPEQDQVNPDQSDEASQGPEQEQVNPDQASEASQGPEQQPQQEGQDEDQDTEAVTGARDRKKNKNETMPGKAGAKPKTGGQGTGESQMTLF